MSIHQLSSMIDCLYAAAYDPQQWREALRIIGDFTCSDAALLSFVPHARNDTGRAIGGQISDEICNEFARDYMKICPRIAYNQEHPEVAYTYDSLIMSETEMDENPVYRWWGRQGLRYHVGAALPGTDAHYCNFSLQRAQSRGHAGDADIKSFALVVPHLKRAMHLARNLDSMRYQWRFSLTVLNGLPQGLIILDRSGRTTFINAAAEAMLRTNDALHVKNGHIAAKRQSDAHKLNRAIHAALGDNAQMDDGQWLSIGRPTTPLPYSIFVAPLAAEATFDEVGNRGVLVVIHDLTRKATVDENVLSTLFGLTTKEASVASAIGSGLDLTSVAANLHIAPATARVHLGSIYRKLSIGRQQDLVGLVNSLTPLGG